MKLKLIVPNPDFPLVHVCNEIEPGIWRSADTIVGENWDEVRKYLLKKGHYKETVEKAIPYAKPLPSGSVFQYDAKRKILT